jgi:type II secretory ATPase GspE/PulE/Tfp pilus assembly ATPase PilB-like protein
MMRRKQRSRGILRDMNDDAKHLPSARDAWLRPVLAPFLDAPTLAGALADAGESLWEASVGARLIDDATLLEAAASHLRLSVADLSSISPHALELIDERWALRHRVLPITATARDIVVATADPFDVECERALAFAAGRRVQFVLASPIGLTERIRAAYGRARHASVADPHHHHVPEVQHLSPECETAPTTLPSDDDGATVTRLLDRILAEGIAGRASDIHVEPEEGGIAVRHRIDGVLRLAQTLPRAMVAALVSRVKIISGLDIADRLRPQDGRARVAVNGRAVDLRISTLPASHGEKVVIRVLDERGAVRALEEMGFADDEHARVRRLLESREGIILVTGPTGSGKTTTLYAALREVQRRGVNVVTVEDPVEYRLPGVVQVQVRERSGLTFGAALRSIMRQDPDVILIGEIRDRETAEIAIQASLTGHLVFSTLHTNDAASAVTRLLDMGVEPHKLATALKGVLAQRLVRRVCRHCRGLVRNEEAVRGCSECSGTGYHGRLAVVEILLVDSEVERLIANGSAAEPIATASRRGGMRSLWQSGLARVHDGDTTMEELLRVAEPPWESGVGAFGADDAPAAAVERAASPRGSAARATFLALRLRRSVTGAPVSDGPAAGRGDAFSSPP